ncbi:MAG TPA: translocation protein TolB [Nautiliaceae bacterium]|nr:translocation protein TolB [Nautiliaceae bacterium]
MIKKFLFLILGVFLAANELVITKYFNMKPKIAINFSGDKNVLKILKMDLTVLDHFNFTINKENNATYRFDFSYNNNTLKVKYFVNNKMNVEKIYRSNNHAYFPFLVHKAVYDINEFFKMPKAKFLIRKVIYSLLVAPKKANIYIADYTFSYKKLIISGGLNVFPKWAEKNQDIIYYTKYERLPTLYRFNLRTGKREKILTSQGILIVSDVKKDKLLLTLALNGAPDVYEYNLKNKRLIKITKYPGIDVNGKFWGEKIAFVSDRYGIPLVFSKNKLGIERVLYHGKNQVGLDTYKNYLVISSRETNRAFASNTFNLFLINKEDDSLKRLTFKGQNSYPNFSVDGNSIMFIKTENFYSKIGIIRLRENKIFYYPLNKKLQSFDW